MPEMNIDLAGRKLLKSVVDEQSADKIVSTSFYDDGTEINFIQEGESVSVKNNKQLVLRADGKTVKIVG